MSTGTPVTSAPPPATDPLAPRGPQSLTIDMAKIRTMSMSELLELREAIHTTCDVVCGLMGRPQFWKSDEDCTLNHAGHVLADINEVLCGFEAAVVNVAKAARPETGADAQAKGWLLVRYEADCRDDLTMVSAAAASAVLEERDARMNEKRVALPCAKGGAR
jgi:hypothetical protein